MDTRIPHPGVSPPPGLKSASQEVLRRSRETQEARKRQELSPEQKVWVCENVTLRGYYEHFLAPMKQLKRKNGKLSNSTLQKDRQALNRWERYTQPEDWPTGRKAPKWEGLVFDAIDEEDIEEFFERALLPMKDGKKPLAVETVRSTWNHLRSIFNHAWRQGVLSRHISPETLDSDSVVTIFEPEQLTQAYRAFEGRVDLQVAFAIGIAAGPRTEDVFCLEWEGVKLKDRSGPTLYFTARKTGKDHAIPLAPWTVRQIERLERRGRYLFPGLSEPENKDPGKSRTARDRNAEIRARLETVGIEFRKPFQAARATCNERLESCREGVGQFVLGHGLTLNSKSYRKPGQLIRETINNAPVPECFVA